MGIRTEVAGLVDDVIGDVNILLNVRKEDSQQFRGNEELEVGLEMDQLQKREMSKKKYLLVHKPITWAPSEDIIITGHTVDSRL